VKGMYGKARSGIIQEFTGVSSPYEIPLNPDIIITTDSPLEENCEKILAYLVAKKYIV